MGRGAGGRKEGREPRPTAACFLDSLSTISRARAAPGIGLRSTDVCSPASKYPAASRPTLTRSLSDLSKSVPHSATRVVYVRAATACGGAAGGRTIAASILKLPPKLPRVRRGYIQRVRPGIDFDSGTETPFLGSCPKRYSLPLTRKIIDESGIQENAPRERTARRARSEDSRGVVEDRGEEGRGAVGQAGGRRPDL